MLTSFRPHAFTVGGTTARHQPPCGSWQRWSTQGQFQYSGILPKVNALQRQRQVFGGAGKKTGAAQCAPVTMINSRGIGPLVNRQPS